MYREKISICKGLNMHQFTYILAVAIIYSSLRWQIYGSYVLHHFFWFIHWMSVKMCAIVLLRGHIWLYGHIFLTMSPSCLIIKGNFYNRDIYNISHSYVYSLSICVCIVVQYYYVILWKFLTLCCMLIFILVMVQYFLNNKLFFDCFQIYKYKQKIKNNQATN